MDKLQRRNVRQSSGFTLIELLISVSILSLLMFTGSYSYSLMSNRWNKDLGSFNQTAQDSKNAILLQGILEGIRSHVVTDEQQTPSFFFIGNEDSLLAVTSGGLFSDNSPEIFRLTIVKGNDEKFDLVYQSTSSKLTTLVGTSQNVSFRNKIILFEAMDGIELQYFGWESSEQKSLTGGQVKPPQWFARYSGIDFQMMPINLSITLRKEQQSLTIPVQLDESAELMLSPYRDAE